VFAPWRSEAWRIALRTLLTSAAMLGLIALAAWGLARREREREEMQRQLQQAAKMEAIGGWRGALRTTSTTSWGRSWATGSWRRRTWGRRRGARHVDQVMQAGHAAKAGRAHPRLQPQRLGRARAGARAVGGRGDPGDSRCVAAAAGALGETARCGRYGGGGRRDPAAPGGDEPVHQCAAGDGARRGAYGGAGESGSARAPPALARHAGAGSLCAPLGKRHRQRHPPAVLERMFIRSLPPRAWATARAWGCRWCTASSPTSAGRSM